MQGFFANFLQTLISIFSNVDANGQDLKDLLFAAKVFLQFHYNTVKNPLRDRYHTTQDQNIK